MAFSVRILTAVLNHHRVADGDCSVNRVEFMDEGAWILNWRKSAAPSLLGPSPIQNSVGELRGGEVATSFDCSLTLPNRTDPDFAIDLKENFRLLHFVLEIAGRDVQDEAKLIDRYEAIASLSEKP